MEADELVRYKVADLERFRDRTEEWRRQVDVDRRDLEYLREEMKEVVLAVNALRKMLLTFSFTISGSAVVFALTVLIATGKIHG